MTEPRTNIESIRAEIDNLSSPEFPILARCEETNP